MLNRKNLSQIKCIVVEVDGVLTDGKTWLNHHGHQQRKFSVRDSMAIRRLTRAGYSFAVVTASQEKEITEHFETLGVSSIFLTPKNRTEFEGIANSMGARIEECAFMHFSVQDLSPATGISATVANAPQEVRTSVQHVSGCEGGEGALAEFAQLILDHGFYSSYVTARKAANL